MDYFEQLINELNQSIIIETDKMLEYTKKLQESTEKIEELKRQKHTIMALTTHVEREY